MHTVETIDQDLFELSREALDSLPYGVITLDRRGTILRYNQTEAAFARRSQERTIGLNFFADVAPCTNVQAFKGRFDAFAAQPDSGVDRFDFAFAFRWGRADVSITLLRKAQHDEINVVVRGRSMAAADAAAVTVPPELRNRRRGDGAAAAADLRPFGGELGAPASFAYASPEERAWRERIHPDDAPGIARAVEAARARREAYAVEYRALDGDRRPRAYLEQGAPWGDGGLATVVDVTERRSRADALWRAANYDALTGLASRSLVLRRIEDAAAEAAALNRIAAVLFLDLDGFKSINDTFGHDVGDELLRALALRLGECVRGGDTVARLNGDEFVVLLTDLDDVPTVERTVRRVLSAVARPVAIRARVHYVTASVGVSMAPYHGTDAALLLRAADSAMYASKKSAKNGFQWFTAEMSASIAANVQIEEELRLAIERGELEPYYQPIVDLVDDHVVAAEALVRWNHPERGLVMPAQFIGVAERSGLITAIGEHMLRSACRQVVAWKDAGHDIRVCVNISSGQFRQTNFAETVRGILIETGAPAERIELEVTESMMIDGFNGAMDVLTALKMLGVRLAVDDFGTGYSSLAYLKYLPVDTLKIDRAFIADIAVDRFDRAIATAVLALASDLKLHCIAEGIEEARQAQILRELGCRHAQGFLFGRPVPARDFRFSPDAGASAQA
jgi:photoactive yellow protein